MTAVAVATLWEKIRGVYGKLPPDFLWDTSKVWDLIHPTYAPSHFSSPTGSETFDYLGRARAEQLSQAIDSIAPGRELTILGAKGSGKSTVVAAIAGQMLAAGKRVVYLCGSRFVQDPLEVLRHSLMMISNNSQDDQLVSDKADDLIRWCRKQDGDALLFIVDEWEEVVKARAETLAYLLRAVSIYHKLVKVVSGNSRDLHLLSTNDQRPPLFYFDGPYNRDEFTTWIAQCQLSPRKLQHLEALTGWMPRLMRMFAEVDGSVTMYCSRMDPLYTNKLEALVRKQETKSQLLGFLQLLLTGKRPGSISSDFDFTCFFRTSEEKLVLLCPYLRARAEAFIIDQQKEISRSFEQKDMSVWANAVLTEGTSRKRKRNPARAGWNVESLLIAVMRYQRCVWPGAPFEHYRTYESGSETAVLRSLQEEELAQGVLVTPLEFNQPYVDAMYLWLTETKDGKLLVVKAIQISVSTWERKKRKKSHVLWQERVLPRWLAEGWQVSHQFVYILPTQVSEKSELPRCSKLRDYVAAVDDDAGAAEDDDDEEFDDGVEDEVYNDDISLSKVEDVPLEFKTFASIHSSLSKFDRMFQPIEQQPQVEKGKLVLCSGTVVENGMERGCRNKSRTKDETYLCHAHRA